MKDQIRKGQGPTAGTLVSTMSYDGGAKKSKSKKDENQDEQNQFRVSEKTTSRENSEVQPGAYVTGMSLQKELKKGKLQIDLSSSDSDQDGDGRQDRDAVV